MNRLISRWALLTLSVATAVTADGMLLSLAYDHFVRGIPTPWPIWFAFVVSACSSSYSALGHALDIRDVQFRETESPSCP